MTQDTFIQSPTGGKEWEDVNVVNPVSDPVNVTIPGGIATFPAGLSKDYRVTTMIISDTATPIPAVPLTDRNAISITNLDGINTLYIGKITVTPDRAIGTTAGWETGAGESFNVDITDTIIIYGVAPVGQTILVKVLEIA